MSRRGSGGRGRGGGHAGPGAVLVEVIGRGVGVDEVVVVVGCVMRVIWRCDHLRLQDRRRLADHADVPQQVRGGRDLRRAGLAGMVQRRGMVRLRRRGLPRSHGTRREAPALGRVTAVLTRVGRADRRVDGLGPRARWRRRGRRRVLSLLGDDTRLEAQGRRRECGRGAAAGQLARIHYHIFAFHTTGGSLEETREDIR